MALISDILLVAGALGAAFYCMVLARRLRRFNDLEGGMGGAIAVLSAQVDDMTRALEGARSSARDSSTTLVDLTGRAEGVAQRLELLVASLHDLPLGDVKPAAGKTGTAPGAQDRPEPATAPAKPVAQGSSGTNGAGKAAVDRDEPVLTFIRSRSQIGQAPGEPPLVLKNRQEAAE